MQQIDAIQLRERFGEIDSAALPGLYVKAKADLAECSRVDECKAWSDRAEAIRSYARQAGDDELMHTAMRIKSRAVERLGSLLEDLAKAQGKRRDLPDPGQVSPTQRQEAIQSAGLSEHQADQAQSVARFARYDPERYSAMVDGERPATVKRLAREGRRPSSHRGAAVGGAQLKAILSMTKRVRELSPTNGRHREAMLRQLDAIAVWATDLAFKLRGKGG